MLDQSACHGTYVDRGEIVSGELDELRVKFFEERCVVCLWKPLRLAVLAVNDESVHQRHVQEPQEDTLVVLPEHKSELNRVSLQPQLVVDINAAHPALIVHEALWTRQLQSLTPAQPATYS